MYTADDLKSLATYMRTVAEDARKKDPPDDSGNQELMAVVRQLEAIRFHPKLFNTLLKKYETSCSLMEAPLKRVALHINDAGIVSKTIVTWRCSNAR